MFVNNSGYILFSHYCDDDRARVSTGMRWRPKADGGLDREKLKKSEQLLLNRVEDAVTKHIESCRRTESLLLKSEVENIVKKALGKDASRGTFVADYKQLLIDMGTGALLHPKHHTRYSPDTIANYGYTLGYLERFSEATGAKLTYNLNEEWVKAFIVWLTSPKTVKKKVYGGKIAHIQSPGCSKNSISVIVGNLKNFLGHMYKAPYKKHSSLFYKHDIFYIGREDTDAESLTVDEITAVYDLQLSGARERARDVFVFGCWVGLRFDDLQRINDFRLKGDSFFEMPTQKTGETVIIPVHPIARTIYEKYAGKMPVYKSGNNLNRHISAMCRQAGIKEQCLVTMTIGGKKVSQYYEKCDLISIHSARRSFATNAVKAGIKERRVMQFTGHQSETSFRRYIRINKKENAESLADHPFFKGGDGNSSGAGSV